MRRVLSAIIGGAVVGTAFAGFAASPASAATHLECSNGSVSVSTNRPMFENPEKPKPTRMKLVARFDDCIGGDGVASVVVKWVLKYNSNRCTFLDGFGQADRAHGIVKWLDDRGRKVAKWKPITLQTFYSSATPTRASSLLIQSHSLAIGLTNAVRIENTGSYETSCRSSAGFTGWESAPGAVTLAAS